MVTYSTGTAVKDRVEMQLKLQLLLVGGALWQPQGTKEMSLVRASMG